MPKLLPRIAAALAALPLAATLGTAPAAADTTVPGCYGVAVVVCDVTVEWGLPAGVGTYETQVPICAGSCTYVPVTLVGTAPGEPLQACVGYRTLSGSVVRHCAVGGTGVDPGSELDDILAGIDVASALDEIGARLDEILAGIDVASAIEKINRGLERLLGPVLEDLQNVIDQQPICSVC